MSHSPRSTKHIELLFGGLLVATILRPSPAFLGPPEISNRVIDALWFVLAVFLFLAVVQRKAMKRIFYVDMFGTLLLIMLAFQGLSLFWAGVGLGQQIVIRDIFEFYRLPYYFLVYSLVYTITAITQPQVIILQFRKSLYAGIFATSLVVILQGLDGRTKQLADIFYFANYASPWSNLLTPVGLSWFRISGTFMNPNWFSVFLMVVLPFSFVLAYPWRNLKLLLVPVLVLILIILTGSRTGWMATAFVMTHLVFMLLILKKKQSRSVPTKFIVLFFVLILLAIWIVSQTGRFRFTMSSLSSNEGILGDYSLRTKYELSLNFLQEMLEKSPLLGMGPSKAISTYIGDNQFSKTMYRYGLFGIGLFFLIWIISYLKSLRLVLRGSSSHVQLLGAALSSSVIGFLVSGIGADSFEATQVGTIVMIVVAITHGFDRKYISRDFVESSSKSFNRLH